MNEEQKIKDQLARHLKGGEAYMPVTEMLEKISYDDINVRPANLPYSFYELFYHIVFAQKDIVKFTCSDDYIAPKWPEYYWPKEKSCKSKEDWESLKAEYITDRERLSEYLLQEGHSVTMKVKNAKEGQTLLREIILVIEHTAYHTGQLMIVLRLLNLH